MVDGAPDVGVPSVPPARVLAHLLGARPTAERLGLFLLELRLLRFAHLGLGLDLRLLNLLDRLLQPRVPRASLLVLLEEVRVVAHVVGHHAAVEVEHPRGDPPEEVAVVRDGDDGALERLERLLEHLLAGDVEVVGGLVQEEDVGGGDHELGERQPSLLTARQELDGFLVEAGAELHLAEERLEVVEALVGSRLHQRLQHAHLRVQTLSLVLVEVVHLALVVVAHHRGARERLLLLLHQPHHRGLAAAVGTDHRHALAAVNLERRVLEQSLLVVPVRQVLDARDDLGRPGRVREPEPPLLLHPRFLDGIFQEAGGLLGRRVGSARLAAAGQPPDHLAIARHLLHELLVLDHLLRAAAHFLTLVVAVVALERGGAAALNLDGFGAQLVEKLAIVRDDDHGHLERI